MARSLLPISSSLKPPHLAADRFPAGVAARHVARVKARLAQGDRHLATDVKTIDAVGDNRLFAIELADPLVDAVGIAPHRTLHDLVRSRAEVTRTAVDDLHRRALLDHRAHLLDADRGHVAELLLLERPGRRHLDRILIATLHRIPV